MREYQKPSALVLSIIICMVTVASLDQADKKKKKKKRINKKKK